MKLRRFLLHNCFVIISLITGLITPVLADTNLSLSDQLCSAEQINIIVDTDIIVQSFKWTGPSITDDSNINATVNGPGLYTLTIFPQGNGDSETATIEILDLPIQDFIISSTNVITCTEKKSLLSTDINDTNQYSYSWTSFSGMELGTGPTHEATFAGIHFLEITNAIGCTKKTSIVVIADIPNHNVTLSMDSLTCDEVGKLYITSPDEIIGVFWTGPLGFSTSIQNPDISVVGSYKAKITFSDSCQVEKTIKADYLHFAPDIEITGDVINCDFPEVKPIVNTNANYQYQWSSVYSTFTSSDPEPLIDHRGVFEVKVMDNSGCEAIYYPLVRIDTITAKFDIIVDTINCYRDSTLLDYNYNATNFQSYEWSGAGINPSNKSIEKPTVDIGGIYSIIGKTLNGCLFERTVEVIVDIEPINITNKGDNITIDCINTSMPLAVTTDRPAAKHQWFRDGELVSQAKIFEANKVGNYKSVIIGSNGCSDQAFYRVDGDITTPLLNNNSTTSINCKDSMAIIDISITDDFGGDEYTYVWHNENMIPTIETALNYDTAIPGLYIIVTENIRNGCHRIDTIAITKDITLPEVEVYTDTINCELSQALIQVTSDTTNINYNWTSEAGNIANVSKIYANGSQPIILKTTGANACISIDTIMINHDTIAPIVNLLADVIIGCTVDNLNIKAQTQETDNYRYEWFSENGNINSDNNDSIITVGQEGIYYLISQSNSNKCTFLDSISITVGESQLRNIDIEKIDPKCSNDDSGEFTIYGIDNAIGTLSFALDESIEFQSDPTFDNLSPDDYLVKLIDDTGCAFDTIINIKAGHSIDIQSIDAMTIDEGELITIPTTLTQSGNEVTYTWYGSDITDCDTCTVMTFDAYSNQTISVIAKDENGCSDRADIHIFVSDLPDIWLANIFSPSASDAINQSLPIYTAPFVQSVEAINVYDRWGNEVMALSDLNPEDIDVIWDGTYNGSKVADGVYSILIKYTLKSGEQFSNVQSVTLIN